MHVRVLGLWSGPEFDSFVTVKSAWEQNTGGTVDWKGTRDLPGELDAQIEAGTPPDIAILPNIGLMHELADEGQLVALPSVMDMDQLQKDYAPAWIDLGSHDGELYGIFYKVTNKATVWYNPKAFAAADYRVPSTWDEMIALADTMVADGRTPFSVVAPNGPGGGGWALTDWISQIVLNNCGPDLYDQWVAGQIPWTDACIKQSFDMFDTIVQTPGYVLGGSEGILGTSDAEGSYPMYSDPPTAYMYYLASFAQAFIASKYPQPRSGRRLRLLPVPDHQPRGRRVDHHRRRRRGHAERHPRGALVHDLPRRCRVATGMGRTRRLHLRQPQRRCGRLPRPGGSGGGRRARIGQADPFQRRRHDAGLSAAGMVEGHARVGRRPEQARLDPRVTDQRGRRSRPVNVRPRPRSIGDGAARSGSTANPAGDRAISRTPNRRRRVRPRRLIVDSPNPKMTLTAPTTTMAVVSPPVFGMTPGTNPAGSTNKVNCFTTSGSDGCWPAAALLARTRQRDRARTRLNPATTEPVKSVVAMAD